MKHVAVIGLFIILSGLVPPPASQPAGKSPITTRPTTTAATQPAVNQAQVRRLVKQLGARKYADRQTAQKRLAALGEAALPHLVEFIDSPDAEIASRVSALMTRPKDPNLRVEVAVRLLSTANPDHMETAVYMLFESPLEDCERFIERTKDAKGIQRVIFDPVAEQLENWKRLTEIFNRNYERFSREKPEAAARILELHRGSKYYQAEAAYWLAVAAMEDFRTPQSQPTQRTAPTP